MADTKYCYACGETKPIKEFMAKYEGMHRAQEYGTCNGCWVAFRALNALGCSKGLGKGTFADGDAA